jgi:predicted dehydrogenase
MRHAAVLIAFVISLFVAPPMSRAATGETAAGALQFFFEECNPGSPCLTVTGSLTIAAHDSDPLSPTDDMGHVMFETASTLGDISVVEAFDGDVDCLNVVGNTATISGEITRTHQEGPTTTFPQFGDRFMVTVVDGGHPVGGTPPDTATIQAFAEGAVTDPVTCVTTGNPATFGFLVPQHGNIIVRDDQ